MKRPIMVLLCGTPGAGKTTYAKDLAKKTGFRYLSIDDMYAVFNGDPCSHENKFQVWMTFWQQIHAAEIAGQNIIVDTNAPTVDDRSDFLNWFPEFHHILVWVDATVNTCFENNQKRQRVIPVEQMKDMMSGFMPPSMGECVRSRAQWKKIVHIKNIKNKFERLDDIT